VNADPLQSTQNFSSECWFTTNNTISAANADSLQTTQFRLRMLIHCKQHNFGSEYWFTIDYTISATNADPLQTTKYFKSECWLAANNTILAANTDSLQTTHSRQRTPDSLRTTQF
jgi:hypothetical protein